MIWHLVRLDFGATDAETRAELERRMAGLAAIPEVGWLRIARDFEQPHVTGLMTAFADRGDLETYRTHPDHVPVLEANRAAGVVTSRIDIETPDAVTDLPDAPA